jgi:hypothetical protein
MRRFTARRLVGAVGMGLSLSFAAAASAQGGDDHTAAAEIVKQLESNPARAALAADALVHAKEALERATRLRSAGDEPHAKAADGLAREWAEDARDIARAAETEAAAAEARRKAVDAQAQVERTRALVEEGIARIGRLTAELSQVEHPAQSGAAHAGASAGKRAVEVHAGEPEPAAKNKTSSDGGSRP